jgi:predicted metallopeptidase
LNVRPQYLIEVLAEHYDALDRAGRLKILIHELLHIPRTFSGAVRGHRGQGERIDDRTVERYFKRYCALGGADDGTDRDDGQMAIRFEKP